MDEALLHALKNHLFYTPGPMPKGEHKAVYGVFDAARYDGFWLELDLWNLPHACLYRGDCDKIASVAPYLIALDIGKDAKAVDTLLAYYGNNGCVFLESSHHWEATLTALQDLFHIRLEDDTPALLRFYDPRIIHDILTALDDEGRGRFFTAIRTWWIEDNTDSSRLVTYFQDPAQGVGYRKALLVKEDIETSNNAVSDKETRTTKDGT